MFGMLIDHDGDANNEVNVRLGRFAQRSFRDVDWGALATASINLTSSVVSAVSNATRNNTTNTQPNTSCPSGYVFDTASGYCRQYTQTTSGGGGGGGGSFLSNIDPMTLMVGVGLLAAVVLLRKD